MDPRSIALRASLTLGLVAGCGDRKDADLRVARPTPSEPGPGPSNQPAGDKEQCSEDPAACGSLTAIPASPLWLVQTANSRG